MYRLIIFILAINVFAFSYAGDSNEGNDRYACVGYFNALDEEIMKMIKADKMPACWDKKWNNMLDEVEENLDMKEEDLTKLEDCLDEVYVAMENKPEPDEKCKEAMKKVSSSDDSSKE